MPLPDTITIPHPRLRITVAPYTRRPGHWVVYVDGIQRTTRPTKRGALGYAQRLAQDNL
jgi:hypothetical protein